MPPDWILKTYWQLQRAARKFRRRVVGLFVRERVIYAVDNGGWDTRSEFSGPISEPRYPTLFELLLVANDDEADAIRACAARLNALTPTDSPAPPPRAAPR